MINFSSSSSTSLFSAFLSSMSFAADEIVDTVGARVVRVDPKGFRVPRVLKNLSNFVET